MQAIAIPAMAHATYAHLVDSMHRLRARVFAGRLGWDVKVRQGREVDEFDRFGPTYVLAVTPISQVVGSARLPRTGP